MCVGGVCVCEWMFLLPSHPGFAGCEGRIGSSWSSSGDNQGQRFEDRLPKGERQMTPLIDSWFLVTSYHLISSSVTAAPHTAPMTTLTWIHRQVHPPSLSIAVYLGNKPRNNHQEIANPATSVWVLQISANSNTDLHVHFTSAQFCFILEIIDITCVLHLYFFVTCNSLFSRQESILISYILTIISTATSVEVAKHQLLVMFDEIMKSALYQKLLKEKVWPSIRDLKLNHTWVRQQDNDPKNASKW